MGKHQRNKGARWEREVAQRFRLAIPGAEAHRTASLQAGNPEGWPDVLVIFPGDRWPAHLQGLAAECKVGKRPPIAKAWEQALDSAPEDTHPLAVIKQDHCAPICVLKLDFALELISSWYLNLSLTEE